VLRFDGGKTVRAGLPIGADGKASVVHDVHDGRRRLGGLHRHHDLARHHRPAAV
jgi:hypothetical protein